MKTLAILSIATVSVLLARVALSEDTSKTDAQLKRGKYLVERVGMCGDCHSPRDQKGQFIQSSWLQGSAIEFKPLHPMPFAVVAPPIAGLPTYTNDVQAIKFLETGVTASGKPLMPPMPQFRFEHDDATAVVVYLRSLKKS